MNRFSALALLLAIAVALALRLPHLGDRPLHNDEAVNAVKLAALLEQGKYTYDPHEYHGPSLHYFSLPFLWLTGATTADRLSDSTLRIVTVAFGVGLILLLLLFADGLGRCAIGFAAFFIAISPSMVFYSRYFIHEMLLVFFTALMIGAGWRWYQTNKIGWAILAGVGLGLMSATKETFVLTLAAGGIAIAAEWTLQRFRPGATQSKTWKPGWQHIAAIFAAAAMWFVLFTSFFTNWNGPLDSVRTYFPWLERAGGQSPHIHSWGFYFERLGWFHPPKSPVWSEGLILILAVIGLVVSLSLKKTVLHRFLAVFTVVLTAIYCIISYKTPWCLLSFWFGMILLAGIGAAAIWEHARSLSLKVAFGVALALLTIQLGWQACQASDKFAADTRNPYTYAQTSRSALALVDKVRTLGKVAPSGNDTVVKVIAPGSEYWPLPWYLRQFKNIGWYEALPEDPYAPIVIVASKLGSYLDEKSEKKWIMAGLFEFRPGYSMELYVEFELWKKYVERLPRPVEEP